MQAIAARINLALGSRRFLIHSQRLYSSQDSRGGKYVLGCGSNVVDHIYNVRVVPKAGEKGFFLSPFKALEAKLIGGVTLNHLCWAAYGGVPSGLLALQGNDEQGRFIRENLQKTGVTTKFIQAKDSYSTAQCHVFIEESGERAIYMAPAASSLITTETARESFSNAIKTSASMVTTEISQIPFTGVLEILKMAKEAGVMSVLDVDVPPSVAIHEARLGEMSHLIECLKIADVLKPAKSAANELVEVLNMQSGSLTDIAQSMMEKCGSKMVAVTDGDAGSIIAADGIGVTNIDPVSVSSVVDTTGAGDAFLGGLIVGLTKYGYPNNEDEMMRLGTIANSFGATCVQSVGGVPVPSSRNILQKYLLENSLDDFQLTDDMSSTDHTPPTIMTQFTNSLLFDTETLSSVNKAYTNTSGDSLKSADQFISTIESCQGYIYTSGIGKSGIIASRLAATLSSIGIPAHYVPATEWVHGDLGKLKSEDVCIFFSHSGMTEETTRAALHVTNRQIKALCVTCNKGSPLCTVCDGRSLIYDIDTLKEPFDCLPTTTLVVQEALCNAIVYELIDRLNINKETFKKNHPGGAIGSES